ncbi:MAG: hypothetical protein AB7P34_19730, partial [Vicinamibacterales bacterium]
MRRPFAAIVFVALAATVALAGQGHQRRFYPDDPQWVDRDTHDVPATPAAIELSDLYDRFRHIIALPGAKTPGESRNVNTLGEVPDSSWYQNRHAAQRMSIAELVRGPDTTGGPDLTSPWRVVRGKTQGLTPGFDILDGRGHRYVIKLDPFDLPELSSSAEVISTKIFHALGYYTPENYIVLVDPARLMIEPGTLVADELGTKRPLTPERLAGLLRDAPRRADGRIRVTASLFVSGKPIGPFRYFGTRSDDPTDVIPHEDRRELRGLRVFSAWLNHDDTRAQNTLDSWVQVGDAHYVRHHLIDFGSTLGSGSIEAQLPWLGFDYWLDPGLLKRNALGFGTHVPAYHRVRFPSYPSVGRFEAEAYQPHAWKNDYPNPAFVRMTERDAFWATKTLMAFTREELAAIVATGQYTDAAAEAYVLRTLVKRQQKTGAYYLARSNPLDEFTVAGAEFRFVNLADKYGLAGAGTQYHVEWSSYDDATGASELLAAGAIVDRPRSQLPEVPLPVGASRYLKVVV